MNNWVTLEIFPGKMQEYFDKLGQYYSGIILCHWLGAYTQWSLIIPTDDQTCINIKYKGKLSV